MNTKHVLISLLFLLIVSCSQTDENGKTDVIQQTFRLTIENTVSNSTSTVERITTVSAYVFNNGLFYKAYRNLSPNASGEISFSMPVGALLYFLSNTSGSVSLSSLEEGKTSLATFINITNAPSDIHTATHAPEFFSGKFVLTEENREETSHKIALTRSVARFDLDTSRDPKTEINRIVIENASTSTLLFAATSPASSSSKRSYEISYNPAFSGTSADVFRIYESNEPVKVTVYGTYNNIPIVVRMEQPQVERNKIYKIVIKNAGSTITGVFEILPWEDGGTVEGFPDATEKITIDKTYSVIPSDVSIVSDRNEVNIPNTGTDMTLAFRAASSIELAKIEGQTSDVSIVSDGDPTSTADGVISKFRLHVAPQGKGRLSYSVILNMRHSLQTNTYDQVHIVVAKSAYQIEEVLLGGVTWMAFNARSRDLEDQIYTVDGSSVEEMYNFNWLRTIGGIFQWGRIYMYTPWESGKNNQGGQAANIPWSADTHMPCPDGYRVPTKTELQQLLPNGQPIPGMFNYNGETIKTELLTATEGFTTPTGVKGTARYIKLTSQSTGNKLFIPLAGQKGDKSGSNNPSFGQGIFLWSNNNQGVSGGWANGVQFWPENASSGTVTTNAALQAEGYAYVRCVKK